MLWNVIPSETYLTYTWAPNPIDPAEVLILTNKSKLGELENHPLLGLFSSKGFYTLNVIRFGYNIIFQLRKKKSNKKPEGKWWWCCHMSVVTALCLTAVQRVLKLCQTTVGCYLASTYISVSVSFIKYLFTGVTITLWVLLTFLRKEDSLP